MGHAHDGCIVYAVAQPPTVIVCTVLMLVDSGQELKSGGFVPVGFRLQATRRSGDGCARRAYLPRFVDAALRKHDHPAAIVAGARHVPVSRTVLVESVCRQGGMHSGTVPTGRGSRDDSRESTAGIRGVGLASEKSGMALPATLLLTRAPHRDCGGRAAAARLPPS